MYHIALVGIYTVRSLYSLHRQLQKKNGFYNLHTKWIFFFQESCFVLYLHNSIF